MIQFRCADTLGSINFRGSHQWLHYMTLHTESHWYKPVPPSGIRILHSSYNSRFSSLFCQVLRSRLRPGSAILEASWLCSGSSLSFQVLLFCSIPLHWWWAAGGQSLQLPLHYSYAGISETLKSFLGCCLLFPILYSVNELTTIHEREDSISLL